MDWKFCTIGLYSWENGVTNMICWYESGKFDIYYDVDSLAADGWEDYEKEISYDHKQQEILAAKELAKKIEGKPIDKRKLSKPTWSNISKLVFVKDNLAYEMIVDENNYVFIVRTFETDKEEYGNIPFTIFELLQKGLKEAGYKEVKVTEV